MTSVRATDRTRPTARFVAWVRSWRAGLVSYDEVAPAIAGDQEHFVAGMPTHEAEVPLAAALAGLSRLAPDQFRLVLPAPGDPRGLPGPGPFSQAAISEGQGVIAGELGFVPSIREHVSGSGDTWHIVCWQTFEVPAAPGEYIGTSDAELELSRELSEAADALTRLDVARWQPELARALANLRRPGSGADLPAGYDQRARRLYARATMLDEVLDLADQHAPGGAVTAHEAIGRAELLRPLRTACRRALMAACNAPMR